MKKFFIGVLAVIVLAVAAALVAPSFIDWNAYRAEIAAEVKKATGRTLTIDGVIDVALLPAPKLSLTKARFANLEGAAAPDMVRLEALDLRIALMPLFSGKLVVQSVVLKGADIRLEHLADGRVNWKFETARKRGSRGAGQGKGGGIGGGADGDRISLEQVVIENSTLTYRDSRNRTVKHFKQINARIAAATLSGPFAARGRFRFGGVPIDFELKAGRIVTGASTKISLEAEFPDAKAKIGYSGLVTPGTPSFTFSGKVSSSGPDLAKLISTVARTGGGKIARKPVIAQPYRLTAEIKGGAEAIAVNDLSMEVNGTRATGAVNIALGATTDIDAVLKVNRLDLDRWRALAGRAGSGAAGAASSRGAKRAGKEFSLPRGLNITLEADIGGFVFNKSVVRDIQFRGRLEKGAARLTRLSARLPGGSDASLSGRLTASRGKPRFDGRVRLDSGDFRALVRWLGGDDSGLAPDRLRKVRFRAGIGIGIQPNQIDLRDMDLRFDASRVTGGMVVVLRERIGIGARLNVDQLNLDAYLPTKKIVGEGKIPGDGKGKPEAPASAAAAPGGSGALAMLGGFDANLKLSVGRLTYDGERMGGLWFDGSLIGGTLKLHKLSVADLAGARLDAKGTVLAIDKSPVPDLEVELTAKNPRRLLSLTGLPLPVAPEKLAPFSLKGTFKAEGRATRLDLGISAGKLSLTAKGALADLAAAPRVALDLRLTHPDFVTFVRLFDPEFKPEKPVKGPFSLAAKVIGTGLNFKLDKFEGLFGKARLSGSATLSLAGLRPRLKGDLTGDEIIVDHFLNDSGPDQKTDKTGGGHAGRGPSARKAGAPWTDEPLDLGVLRLVDADLRIRAKAITWRRWRVEDPSLDLTLEDGKLDMRRLTGRMAGGRFHMTGGLAAPQKPGGEAVTRFDVDASGMDLKQDMFGARDIDITKGKVDFKMALAGRGVSSRAIARSLAGSGSLVATDGVVKGFDLARLNQRVGNLRDEASLIALLGTAMRGGTTRFSRLAGTYKMTGGVLRSKDISLIADGGTGTGELKVDIGRWWMDGTILFRLAAFPQAPPIGRQFKGPLDSPRPKIKMGQFEVWLAKRAAGALFKKFLGAPRQDPATAGDGSGGGTQPQPQPQPSTRDRFIKGIFDILKNR